MRGLWWVNNLLYFTLSYMYIHIFGIFYTFLLCFDCRTSEICFAWKWWNDEILEWFSNQADSLESEGRLTFRACVGTEVVKMMFLGKLSFCKVEGKFISFLTPPCMPHSMRIWPRNRLTFWLPCLPNKIRMYLLL